VPPAHRAAVELVREWRSHVVDDGVEGVLEQLDAEPIGRRSDLRDSVGWHGAIQSDHNVQVHEAASLVLRDLACDKRTTCRSAFCVVPIKRASARGR
jgi:hypothetical protein